MAGSNAAYAHIPHLLRRALLPIVTAAGKWLGADSLPLAGHVAGLPALESGNASRARRIYGGQLPLDFSGLDDFAATGLDLYRVFARKLVRAAHERGGRGDVHVTASRLLSLCRNSGFLLQGAAGEFRDKLLGLAAADIRRLTRTRVRSTDLAVLQTTAVLAASVCFGGPERLRDEAAARLAAAASTVILADGGHVSRRPSRLIETLALLVPLRQLLAARRIDMPQQLTAAIERALSALGMLCHGDGGLSLLQGGSRTFQTLARALLAETAGNGRPQTIARQSGFARLNLCSTTLLVDCGTGGCCDGALAFEFSDGNHRIVGPCGFPVHAPEAWMAAAARRAAQSGLTFEAPLPRNSAPARVMGAEVITSPHGLLFRGEAALHSLGAHHHREIFLSADGADLRGEDGLSFDENNGDGGITFALRFHLHPMVAARPAGADGPILLSLPDGAVWQFSAKGGNLSLEDSIFLATGGAPKKARQIVIRSASRESNVVNWAFRRQPPVAA